MAPMLRFFRHGDGGLALFNGAWEGDRTLIDLVLARSGSSESAPTMALASGFQRLAAGTSLVIADAGSPPGRGMDGIAHAGTLSFEMSAAHERLIVNCGTYPGAPRDWRHFMRYTAAHSHGGGRRHQLDRDHRPRRAGVSRRQRAWSTAPTTRARSGST